MAAALRRHPLFQPLAHWNVQPVAGFEIKPVYRLRRGEHDLFVKRIKPNERLALGLLAAFGLTLAPRIIAPELLHHDVLVAEFIAGGPLRAKRLDGHLISNYARM